MPIETADFILYPMTDDIVEYPSKGYYIRNKHRYKLSYDGFKRKHEEELKIVHRCPCGGQYKMLGKTIHEKSRRHRKWLNPEPVLPPVIEIDLPKPQFTLNWD
jgi:hypothetical protein